MSYFYDELWQGEYDLPENLTKEDMIAILDTYAKAYEEAPDKNTWFDGVKAICEGLGFCPEVKAYKQDPTGWKGHVGDVSNVVRVAITGRKNSPDLWSIMTLLGKERSLSRLRKMKEFLAK